MKLNSLNLSKLMRISLLVACVGHTQTALSQDSLLLNPDLQNGFQSWNLEGEFSRSQDGHNDNSSISINGQEGRISQTVEIKKNTDYTLSGYVKNFGRIGVIFGNDEEQKRIHNASDWAKAEIKFNSGDATTATVYANFYREEGFYDDFSLVAQSKESNKKPVVLCPANGNIPIASVRDDGTSPPGNVPDNAIDGLNATRWSSQGVDKYIEFDLGRIAVVKQLLVSWYKGEERISLFSVETSEDGVDWTMQLSEGGSYMQAGFDNYDIENYLKPNVRFVRITGAGNSKSDWNSISEVKVKGCVNSR